MKESMPIRVARSGILQFGVWHVMTLYSYRGDRVLGGKDETHIGQAYQKTDAALP